MRRREFITLLGSAAAWPIAARGQQARFPVIGFLNTRALGEDTPNIAAFHQGLKEGGFVEGDNLTIEYRFADNKNALLPDLAADLVRRRVAVIVAPSGVASAVAAKKATSTIPIVFRVGADPVQAGIVTRLNRPGGNITGFTTYGTELGPKRLELLHDVIPTATIIGFLVNPTNPIADTAAKDLQAAARILGLQIHVMQASSDADFETAFATLIRLRAGGLVINTDNFFGARMNQLAALTLRGAMPAIASGSEFAKAGVLMSYGSSVKDAYRLVGIYTSQILKGEKPADLPVQEATKVELGINLKTARALGLTFPITLLGRADVVIE